MADPCSYITLRRNRTSSNQLRQFAILVNDKEVGKIGAGQSKQFRLPCGQYQIRIKLDFFKSQPLQLDLNPDDNLLLECGDRAPETVREAFTLKGLEKSLNSLIKPGEYLYVERSGEQPELAIPRQQPTTHNEQPVKPKQKQAIFVSYRRDDSREITGRICDRLNNEYGQQTIFRDVDSIPAGADFREHISQTIEKCQVLLVVIGPNWTDASNSAGQRRLEIDNDPVRVEIETALGKQKPIIPVLVKNGDMPDAARLPESIKLLAYKNAVPIPAEPYFHQGVDRLINELNQTLKGGKATPDTGGKFCTGCGTALMVGQKFCTGCGQPLV